MADLIRGIDVSIVQGDIDFVALAAAGIQFCIVRCGVGNSGIDQNYSKNIAAARAAGLKVAAYNFIYPLPTTPSQPLRDPVAQAQYHFNAAQGELACIDCEWPAPQDFAKWGCTPTQINQWMLAYLAEYERLDGRKPLVYTYPYWAQAITFDPKFAQYPLWIASYETVPTIPKPWTDFVMWQNTGGGGHLPNGAPVDTDVVKDLSLWNVPAAAVVPPVVAPTQPLTVVVVPPAPIPVSAPAPTPAKSNLLSLVWKLVTTLIGKYTKR